jgi:CheY-like chemotaxis protein
MQSNYHEHIMIKYKKIVLVEDNVADVELVKISVKELQIPIELTHLWDGTELIEYLKNTSLKDIGVILLDLNMPRVSGIDVLKFMYHDEVLRHIPVVMFTTSNNKSDILTCYEYGAKAFVSKPLDIAEFNTTIKSIVDFWTSINILPSFAIQ